MHNNIIVMYICLLAPQWDYSCTKHFHYANKNGCNQIVGCDLPLSKWQNRALPQKGQLQRYSMKSLMLSESLRQRRLQELNRLALAAHTEVTNGACCSLRLKSSVEQTPSPHTIQSLRICVTR